VEEIDALDKTLTVAKADLIFVKASVTPGSSDLSSHTLELSTGQFVEAVIRMAHVKYIELMSESVSGRQSAAKTGRRKSRINFARSNSIKEILHNVVAHHSAGPTEKGGAEEGRAAGAAGNKQKEQEEEEEEEDAGDAAEKLLTECVRRLLTKYVLPNAMKSSYEEFHRQMNMPLVLEIIVQFRTKLKVLFTKYAKADDSDQFANSMNLKEFTIFANDRKLLCDGFTRRDLVSVFNNAQSETTDANGASTMLSFPEFVDAVGAISIFKRPNPFVAFETHLTQFLKDITPKERRGSMQREMSSVMSASKFAVRNTRRRNSVVVSDALKSSPTLPKVPRRASVDDAQDVTPDKAISSAAMIKAEWTKTGKQRTKRGTELTNGLTSGLVSVKEELEGAGSGAESNRTASREAGRGEDKCSPSPDPDPAGMQGCI
jgi:hypothetical protein